jgi:hypothetical protein
MMDATRHQQPPVRSDELTTVRLFRGLGTEQRQRLLTDAEAMDIVAGTTIVEEGGGEPYTDLYVLLPGTANVSVRLDGGSHLDVGTLRAGDSPGPG